MRSCALTRRSNAQADLPSAPQRQRSGRIPAAVHRSGLSRSTLYELAPKWPGLFRKNGAATIVDFDVLDRIIDQLPIAEIKPARRKRSH
jgi:hypothetical protein